MTFKPHGLGADDRGDLLNKKYLGIVIDNKDPDKNRRVKIRIRELHRGIEDADLYWVKADIGFGIGGNYPGVGSIGLPPIGSKVWVECLDNMGASMKIVGPAYQKDDKTDELETDDYDAYGFIDTAGNKVFISPEEKTIEVEHVTGTKIKILPNGAIEIISAQNVNVEANGVLNLRGQTVNIDGTSSVNIKGGVVHINQSGSPTAPTAVTARTAPTKRDFTNKKEY